MKLPCVLLSSLLAFGAEASPKKKVVRAASGTKGGAKASAKALSGAAKGGAKASASKISGGSKSAGKKSAKKDKAAAPAKLSDPNDPAPCLRSGINRLLGIGGEAAEGEIDGPANGACKFLLPDDMRGAYKPKDFLCVFQTRASGKAESVWDYYLTQNYGIKEGSVKDGTSVADLRYKKKGLYKYYEYLLSEMDRRSLKENKIFTAIAEEILDRNEVPNDATNKIEDKSVDSVSISMDITRADINACNEAVKAISDECGEMSDPEAKKAVESSCISYDAALTKRAGDKRIEAMSREGDLLEVLLQRGGSGADIEAIILRAREKEADNKEKREAIEERTKPKEDPKSLEDSQRKADELKARLAETQAGEPAPETPAEEPPQAAPYDPAPPAE